mgnify:FL=1|jgi:hypothetical protein
MDFQNTMLGKLLFFAAVCTLSSLGAMSRLASEVYLSPSTGIEKPSITKGIVAAYLLCGMTAGLVLALICVEKYGFSFGLVGMAGAAGFQSVQVLSALALGLNEAVNRLRGAKK